MSRKQLPKGQRTLTDPEADALEDFVADMGEPILNVEVVCPFCAWGARAVEFRTKKSEKSKAYSTRMFECPDCGQRMHRTTLLKDMTPSEWARWLYFDVIMYHGYDRISFPKLLQRLKEYGWAREFWEAWRAAKEGRETSDVEDYLDYARQSSKEARDMCDKLKRGLAGKGSIVCTSCDMDEACWPKGVRI